MPDGAVAQQAEARSDWARADLILEVTRQFISTLELDEVLNRVLSLTVDAIGAERGSLFVIDGAGKVIHKILARWYLPPHLTDEIVSVVLSQGAAGYVLRHRQAVLIADTENDERWVHLPDDPNVTRSALSVPLQYRDQLSGILTLTHFEPGHFDEGDLALAISIAGQAAVAVQNARLFDRVRRERETLHAVIGGVTEGIIITDTDGQIVYANPAGAAVLGVSAIAIRGRSLKKVAPNHRLLELLQALLESGETQRGEIYANDGRVFDASLALVPGAGAVTTLHDVTRFKELDALKSEFVATVSHDMKAPLGLIYGYAWMVAEAPDLDSEVRKYVDIIINGIQKMDQIITSLLDLSTIESGIDQVREPVDLAQLVDECLAAFKVRMREKDLHLAVDMDPALPTIQGHSVRLGQAINNLLSNAVKYTPSGGRIRVSVDLDGDEVRVCVSDTGPGIPLERQAGLFKKFYKVGSKETLPAEGHGLGLAIVKSVAEAHGGRVEVESQVGRGATFTIVLPLLPPANSLDSVAQTQPAQA